MTEHTNTDPDTQLPKFLAHVVPTDKVTTDDLQLLIARFRKDITDPLIMGSNNQPEAVVIPFATFMRLLKRDHAQALLEEHAIQGELARRVRHSDSAAEKTPREDDPAGLVFNSDDEVFAWAGSLGEVGRAWAANQQQASHRGDTDD